MKFDFKDYTDIQCVMYCKTDEEIELFSEMLDNENRYWRSGHSYIKQYYPSPLYFYFNKGTYSTSRDKLINPSIILSFFDFDYEDPSDYTDEYPSADECVSFMLGN